MAILINIIQTKARHVYFIFIYYLDTDSCILFILNRKNNIKRMFTVQCGKKLLTHISE